MNNNKIYNLIAKGIMVVLIVIGVYFTGKIWSDGNPDKLDTKGIQALGTEIAKAEGAQDKMTQSELITYIETKGEEKRQEMSKVLHKDVKGVINFSLIQILIVILTVVLGLVIGLMVNPKKFLISFAIGGGFVGLLLAIYYGVSDEVPAVLLQKENQAVLEGALDEEKKLYLPGNWRIASWAFMSTVILLIGAVFVWIAGEVSRIFK